MKDPDGCCLKNLYLMRNGDADAATIPSLCYMPTGLCHKPQDCDDTVNWENPWNTCSCDEHWMPQLKNYFVSGPSPKPINLKSKVQPCLRRCRTYWDWYEHYHTCFETLMQEVFKSKFSQHSIWFKPKTIFPQIFNQINHDHNAPQCITILEENDSDDLDTRYDLNLYTKDLGVLPQIKNGNHRPCA